MTIIKMRKGGMLNYTILHFLICLLPQRVWDTAVHAAGSHPAEEQGHSASQMHQNLFSLVGSDEIGFARCRHQMLPLPGRICFNVFYFKSCLQCHPPGSKWHHCHFRVMSQMRNWRAKKWRMIKHTEKWAWEQDRLFEHWPSHLLAVPNSVSSIVTWE